MFLLNKTFLWYIAIEKSTWIHYAVFFVALFNENKQLHLWHHCDSIYYHKMTLTFEIHWFTYIQIQMKVRFKTNWYKHQEYAIYWYKDQKVFKINTMYNIIFFSNWNWKRMKTPTLSVQIWANFLVLHYHGLWENSSFPPATFRPNSMNSKINICSMQHYRFSDVEEMSLEVGLNTHTYRLLLVCLILFFVCLKYFIF